MPTGTLRFLSPNASAIVCQATPQRCANWAAVTFLFSFVPSSPTGGAKKASNELPGGHGEHASASASSAHAGVQLQGRTGLASLDGDTVRLRDGHLLLNDQDYGVVASDATVRYRRTAAGKELSVNGKVIATLR